MVNGSRVAKDEFLCVPNMSAPTLVEANVGCTACGYIAISFCYLFLSLDAWMKP